MEIKPIRTETDYRNALARVEELWDVKPRSSESDELDLLAILVEAYQERHHPIDPPDPIEAILFRLDQMGLTRKDLEASLGSRARVSEILNRKRPLSLDMIRRLHINLGIPPEVLIKRYQLASDRTPGRK